MTKMTAIISAAIILILISAVFATQQEQRIQQRDVQTVAPDAADPSQEKLEIKEKPRWLTRGNFETTGVEVTLEHKGHDRQYRIHVPKNYDEKMPWPIVLCLHGGGGSHDQASSVGLSPLADKNNFIAVYPNGINNHWNDGRDSQVYKEHDRLIDDVDYLITVVGKVREEYSVDAKQVFVMGISNGGFMTQRLAMEHSETFSAAGVIVASMGKAIEKDFNPELPVSIVYMNGTADPLVPYTGGRLTVDLFPRFRKLRGKPVENRGSCISTDAAVKHWLNRNGLKSKPTVTKIEDRDKTDSSTVELCLWTGGKRKTAVALYKVIGGGHGVPGTPEMLPKITGRTNQDINGLEKIWAFFRDHHRDAEKTKGEPGN